MKLKKKSKKIIFIAIFIVAIILVGNSFYKHKYKNNSNYCEIDSDCALYECTSCGNDWWIKKNDKNKNQCEKPIKNLLGCVCDENVCKRHYDY